MVCKRLRAAESRPDGRTSPATAEVRHANARKRDSAPLSTIPCPDCGRQSGGVTHARAASSSAVSRHDCAAVAAPSSSNWATHAGQGVQQRGKGGPARTRGTAPEVSAPGAQSKAWSHASARMRSRCPCEARAATLPPAPSADSTSSNCPALLQQISATSMRSHSPPQGGPLSSSSGEAEGCPAAASRSLASSRAGGPPETRLAHRPESGWTQVRSTMQSGGCTRAASAPGLE